MNFELTRDLHSQCNKSNKEKVERQRSELLRFWFVETCQFSDIEESSTVNNEESFRWTPLAWLTPTVAVPHVRGTKALERIVKLD